jgi:Protein of unknown function (DUF998)
VNRISPNSDATRLSRPASWLAIAAAAVTLLLLASLHVLSPEFDPAWRMVSEYALGHYGLMLSLLFLAWGISSWALAVALWPQVPTRAGKVAVWLLVVAGLGEALASVFDITHDVGHAIAGLLGMGGFPIAAVLLSVSLSRAPTWHSVKRPLVWMAHLSWINIVLLVATLAVMTVQVALASGGQLPQHAPTHLPAGALGLDGWADRLFVLSACMWVLVAAWQAMKLQGTGKHMSGRDSSTGSVSSEWRIAAQSSSGDAAALRMSDGNQAIVRPQR